MDFAGRPLAGLQSDLQKTTWWPEGPPNGIVAAPKAHYIFWRQRRRRCCNLNTSDDVVCRCPHCANQTERTRFRSIMFLFLWAYCYKSSSDSAPKASDSTPKTIFGVFFAGRGSTLQADFYFAGDFAGRHLAHNFAGRGSGRPAKKRHEPHSINMFKTHAGDRNGLWRLN